MSFVPVPIPIASITQAFPGVVTTSTNHNLITGQAVRILCPPGYGMRQINKVVVVAQVLTPTSFQMYYSLVSNTPVNTTYYDAFVIPATTKRQTAAVIPIGSSPVLETTITGAYVTQLGDAVENILT